MNIFLGHNFYSFYNLNKTSTGLLLSKSLVIPPNVKLKEFQKRLIHHIANITHAAINCTQYQTKDLGIYVISILSWSLQVPKCANKANSALSFVRRTVGPNTQTCSLNCINVLLDQSLNIVRQYGRRTLRKI